MSVDAQPQRSGRVTIDLAECQILIVGLPQDPRRSGVVAGLCERLGLPYQLIEGIKCSPGWIGCALSHLKALRSWDGKRPLLILEDDVSVTDHFSQTIQIPADADALYLGTTAFGGIPQCNWKGFHIPIAAEEVEPGLARIFNLMATHAILHISADWIAAICEEILSSTLDKARPLDCGFAMLQGDFQVYSLIEPAFYQAGELQAPEWADQQETVTRQALPLHREGTICVLGDPKVQAVRLVRRNGKLLWLEHEFQPPIATEFSNQSA